MNLVRRASPKWRPINFRFLEILISVTFCGYCAITFVKIDISASNFWHLVLNMCRNIPVENGYRVLHGYKMATVELPVSADFFGFFSITFVRRDILFSFFSRDGSFYRYAFVHSNMETVRATVSKWRLLKEVFADTKGHK